ncbi:hypothetical protein [Limnohabitans planktonicus]|uniref:hypothetical protein n=1 Tax=Limnohabitans planktonicus TaxID=540060 RepID=UPI00140262E1|nr:hypothetical protein [Limnohabitans planktonicus]
MATEPGATNASPSSNAPAFWALLVTLLLGVLCAWAHVGVMTTSIATNAHTRTNNFEKHGFFAEAGDLSWLVMCLFSLKSMVSLHAIFSAHL